jgi:hypothetical protein
MKTRYTYNPTAITIPVQVKGIDIQVGEAIDIQVGEAIAYDLEYGFFLYYRDKTISIIKVLSFTKELMYSFVITPGYIILHGNIHTKKEMNIYAFEDMWKNSKNHFYDFFMYEIHQQ